MHCPSITTT